jgi:hypothetical protein
MKISKAPMNMMKNFPQLEILKEVKMIMTMVDTISRVGNLKTAMLVMMNFLQVRILKVLMKIFLQVRISKAQMKMMKNSPQVGILKVMMMIMAMMDNLSRMANLKEEMLIDDFPPSEDFVR